MTALWRGLQADCVRRLVCANGEAMQVIWGAPARSLLLRLGYFADLC